MDRANLTMLNDDFFRGYGYAAYQKQRRQQAEKERRRAYIKQRLAGAALVLLGIVSVPLLDMDGTAAIFLIPMGLYMLLTKELLDDYDEERTAGNGKEATGGRYDKMRKL